MESWHPLLTLQDIHNGVRFNLPFGALFLVKMDAMTTASKLVSDVQSMMSTGLPSQFATQKGMSVQYTVLRSSAGLYVVHHKAKALVREHVDTDALTGKPNSRRIASKGELPNRTTASKPRASQVVDFDIENGFDCDGDETADVRQGRPQLDYVNKTCEQVGPHHFKQLEPPMAKSHVNVTGRIYCGNGRCQHPKHSLI
ncbi:hypothetical protein ACHHYP_11515 [Achlya hypogyna]|uniref:Uncharacterized protein n=1 Tax=Achlya hypogyna TaxID=1202772 RepID=A0A1V9YIZ4_ACHHY|nr:hypothetical protein ACHHYP_11515 [Achlya hypogyna]